MMLKTARGFLPPFSNQLPPLSESSCGGPGFNRDPGLVVFLVVKSSNGYGLSGLGCYLGGCRLPVVVSKIILVSVLAPEVVTGS